MLSRRTNKVVGVRLKMRSEKAKSKSRKIQKSKEIGKVGYSKVID